MPCSLQLVSKLGCFEIGAQLDEVGQHGAIETTLKKRETNKLNNIGEKLDFVKVNYLQNQVLKLANRVRSRPLWKKIK